MDGHRGYPDDTQPSWYTGQNQPYADPERSTSPYDSGVHERPSGAFRLPEQRATETAYQPPAPYANPVPPVAAPPVPPEAAENFHDLVRIPVRGPEYPAVRPGSGIPAGAGPAEPDPGHADPGYSDPGHAESGYSDPGHAERAYSPPGRTGIPAPAERVYRTKRPISALLVAGITGILLIPALVLLFTVTFRTDATGSGVIPAVLLTLGLALAGLGLFALTEEAPATRADWLRPPVVYLPVGLVLLLTAGLTVA